MNIPRVKWASDTHGWFEHKEYVIDLYGDGDSWDWELHHADGNYCGEGSGYPDWASAAVDAAREVDRP